MRKILAAVLAAAIALSGTVFAAGEEEKTYRLLNGLIKSIEVEGGSDSPEKMIDGHYDSFRMYKPPMTTDIFYRFRRQFRYCGKNRRCGSGRSYWRYYQG